MSHSAVTSTRTTTSSTAFSIQSALQWLDGIPSRRDDPCPDLSFLDLPGDQEGGYRVFLIDDSASTISMCGIFGQYDNIIRCIIARAHPRDHIYCWSDTLREGLASYGEHNGTNINLIVEAILRHRDVAKLVIVTDGEVPQDRIDLCHAQLSSVEGLQIPHVSYLFVNTYNFSRSLSVMSPFVGIAGTISMMEYGLRQQHVRTISNYRVLSLNEIIVDIEAIGRDSFGDPLAAMRELLSDLQILNIHHRYSESDYVRIRRSINEMRRRLVHRLDDDFSAEAASDDEVIAHYAALNLVGIEEMHRVLLAQIQQRTQNLSQISTTCHLPTMATPTAADETIIADDEQICPVTLDDTGLVHLISLSWANRCPVQAREYPTNLRFRVGAVVSREVVEELRGVCPTTRQHFDTFLSASPEHNITRISKALFDGANRGLLLFYALLAMIDHLRNNNREFERNVLGILGNTAFAYAHRLTCPIGMSGLMTVPSYRVSLRRALRFCLNKTPTMILPWMIPTYQQIFPEFQEQLVNLLFHFRILGKLEEFPESRLLTVAQYGKRRVHGVEVQVENLPPADPLAAALGRAFEQLPQDQRNVSRSMLAERLYISLRDESARNGFSSIEAYIASTPPSYYGYSPEEADLPFFFMWETLQPPLVNCPSLFPRARRYLSMNILFRNCVKAYNKIPSPSIFMEFMAQTVRVFPEQIEEWVTDYLTAFVDIAGYLPIEEIQRRLFLPRLPEKKE